LSCSTPKNWDSQIFCLRNSVQVAQFWINFSSKGNGHR
jgi:hypothetical protein